MRNKVQRIQFGSWTNGMDADPALLGKTANQLGTPLRIASIFRGIDDMWPYPNDELLGRDRTLLVSWHLGDVANYATWANGENDNFVRNQAIQLRNYGQPIVLRPWAEMNGDWVDFQPTSADVPPKPFGGNYSEFISAWRHIVDIVRQEQATNVKWAFNPSTDTYPETTHVADIYPGDEYVDYLALDGYNWGDGHGLNWREFSDIYREQYGRLTALAPSKPVWIAEIGSSDPNSVSPSEQHISAPSSTDKGRWWQDAIASIRDDFPAIEALVLFDAEKERDWRHDSSIVALRGLRTAITNHLYK